MEFTLNQHIGSFENAFDKGYCNDLIEFFESQTKEIHRREQYWENGDPSLIGKAVDSSIELNTIAYDPENEHSERAHQFMNYFFETLAKYFDVYSRKCNIAPHPFTLTGFKLQKTSPGEGYHIWHCESPSSLGYVEDSKEGWNNKDIESLYTRFAAYTLYLNDVEEGGETEFLMQSYRLPPKAGTLCIFPSGYTHQHRGNPPLKGSKYILTGWLTLASNKKTNE